MIKIFHNPRCSKSRQGVNLLEDSGNKYEIINYLKDTPTESELTEVIEKLNITPIELVRTKEKIWKEHFRGKEMSDAEIIGAMLKYPILIERPIVINGNRAAIGRPIERIVDILK